MNIEYKIGDCLELLKDIPDESIDLVLTDPPYNVGKDYGLYKDNLTDEEYWKWYRSIFKQIFRVMNQGYLYVSCSSRQLFIAKDVFESIGFDYIQYLIWYRPNMTGGTTMIKLPWSLMHEPILLFKKGPRVPMLNEVRGWVTHDVLIHPAPQTNYHYNKRFHITQKPLKLYLHLLARTPGKTVLDPFLGSGTTLVACQRLNRNGIGFEINPEYEAIIRDRLKLNNKKIDDYGGI